MKRYILFILGCFLMSVGWAERLITSFEDTNTVVLPASEEISISEESITNTNTMPFTKALPTESKPQSEDNTLRHMLGIHGGMSSGAGLCYRQYVGGDFSWQVSFLPFYTSQDFEGQASGFVITGFFGQWFLSDFRHPAISLEARFFVYLGAIAGYYVRANSPYDFALGGGGGIGLETYFIKNIVLTIATGYYGNITKNTKTINSVYFNMGLLSFEGTIGYRF